MNLKNLLAVTAIALGAISCNNGDDEVKSEYAQPIAGTYNGSMKLTVGSASQGTWEGMSFTFQRVNEDSVNVVLTPFTFGKYSLPEIHTGAKVTMKGNDYALNGTFNLTVASFKIGGDFDGTVNGKKLEMNINFQFSGMANPVLAVFGGSQLQNSMALDTSDYGKWTYINLKTGETKTLRDFSAWNYLTNGTIVETIAAQGSEADVAMDWHIAIHRYDIKTNNGTAVATTSTVLSEVSALPVSGYQKDEIVENAVIVDMTGMMKSKIGYASTSKTNPILCGWLTKTATGSMPPYIYEPTNLVYVVKNKDGSYAKLKFTDHQNAEGKSGHVTFSYEYVAQ